MTAISNKQDQGTGRKGYLLMTAAALALLGLGWYGYGWYQDTRSQETTNDAYVGADITVIAPKVAGLVAEVAVTDNQTVHAGDLLAKLDDRDYKAALAYAEANVAAQSAVIGNIDARRSLQESLIAQSKAELSGTGAELDRAQRDKRRNYTLVHTDAVSGQTLDHVAIDLQKAVAAQGRAQASVQAAERELDVLGTQRKQAEAALKQAEASRDAAKLNVGYTEIRAPIDGVVGNRGVKTGAYAAVGTQLLSLVPSNGLWVDANFKESQLGGLKPGQKVDIVADVAPGQVFTGHVESLAPATGAEFSLLPPENATGNFTKIVQRVPVRVALDNGAAALGTLRPGLSVSVTVNENSSMGGVHALVASR